jgi:hypothetical protein
VLSYLIISSDLLSALRYGAVVRGSNAYIPPGARKVLPPLGAAPTAVAPVAAPSSSNGASAKGPDVPKVSINAPDGSSLPHSDTTTPASSSKAPSPAPSASQKVFFSMVDTQC